MTLGRIVDCQLVISADSPSSCSKHFSRKILIILCFTCVSTASSLSFWYYLLLRTSTCLELTFTCMEQRNKVPHTQSSQPACLTPYSECLDPHLIWKASPEHRTLSCLSHPSNLGTKTTEKFSTRLYHTIFPDIPELTSSSPPQTLQSLVVLTLFK